MRLHHDFAIFAHPHREQREAGNNGGPWTTWLMLGGRGAGKTRAGAEWVRAMVHGIPPWTNRAHGRIALIGETAHDAREVMVEGGWNGRTARSARRFPPTSRGACAGRNSRRRGATNWRSGAMPKPPSTCCNSHCGSASGRGS